MPRISFASQFPTRDRCPSPPCRCCAKRATGSAPTARARPHRRRERHRVLLPAPARHRDLCRFRTARRRHHRRGPAARFGRPGRDDPAARLRRLDVPLRRPARHRRVRPRPGRQAHRDGVSRGRRVLPARAGCERRGDPARRRRRNRRPAGCRGRDRGRRLDRNDAAQRRADDLRRPAAHERGGADPARAAGRQRPRRATRAPAAGRDHRAAVRADGLRHPRRAGGQAVAITPGIESPTVSPLHHKGWSAVRSMVERRRTNMVMDELWELGARGILVTDIHACRL